MGLVNMCRPQKRVKNHICIVFADIVCRKKYNEQKLILLPELAKSIQVRSVGSVLSELNRSNMSDRFVYQYLKFGLKRIVGTKNDSSTDRKKKDS